MPDRQFDGLVPIDEPGGGEVVPSNDGRLFTLRAPVTPTCAVDLRGKDVLARALARNDETWMSDPFGHDPDRPEDLRDGLELDFPRPPGACAVTWWRPCGARFGIFRKTRLSERLSSTTG